MLLGKEFADADEFAEILEKSAVPDKQVKTARMHNNNAHRNSGNKAYFPVNGHHQKRLQSALKLAKKTYASQKEAHTGNQLKKRENLDINYNIFALITLNAFQLVRQQKA